MLNVFVKLFVTIILISWSGWAQEVPASPMVRHVKVAPNVASALLIQKSYISYPVAAQKAGIQGTVVLRVVVSIEGSVKEASVVSGDAALAQPFAEAVKTWKYKPYTVDGVAEEMETQVSITFHLKTAQHSESPSLGLFRNEGYYNSFFDLYYPLSHDWVRETDLVRKNFSGDREPNGAYVLLAAMYIPEHTAPAIPDSSLVLSALESVSGTTTQSCDQYLSRLADDLHSRKGRPKR